MPKDVLFIGKARRDYAYFATPLISLNQAIGSMQGIRSRGIVQLLGNEACGKTSLAYGIIGDAQRKGALKELDVSIGKTTYKVNAVFVDVERQYDPDYAETCGVDTERLLVIRADSFEEITDVVEDLLKKGIQLVVYDSLPATISKSEIEKKMDDPAKMAETANMVSRWLIRLIGLIDNANALFIFTNQFRANLAPMARKATKPYGPKTLAYYCTLILEMVRIKREETVSDIKVVVEKNKQAAQGKEITLYLNHGKGFDAPRDIIEYALYLGLIRKSGAWYEYKETKAQGIKQCIEKFDLDALTEDIMNELDNSEE